MSANYGTDYSANGWLNARADETGDLHNETTKMLLYQFKFAAAKSIRTSTIILATFNTIAAFGTALRIIYNCYSRRRRSRPGNGFSQPSVPFVASGEVYPLVLSLGITIQGIIFAVAQSIGLKGLVTSGCTVVSQLMLPALFLVPYIQFVFALELALRGLRRKPFPPRGKWTVIICLAVIGLLTLTNFLVADIIRTHNSCFASLLWFVAHYAVGCFALLVGTSSSILICAVVVATKLYRSVKIEVTQRVYVSNMVYYMALAFVSNCFMLPFFFMLAFRDQNDSHDGPRTLTLSMVATVAVNVSGLMTGGLYLFLKSNARSTIGPRFKAGGHDRHTMRPTIQRLSSHASGPDFNGHMLQPVPGPGSLRRMHSDSSLVSNEKQIDTEHSQSPNPLASNPSVGIPRALEPAQMPSGGVSHLRKRSYSLFPNGTRSWKSSATRLPPTTYTPGAYGEPVRDDAMAIEQLKPPPSIWSLAKARHRRDSSMISSATVQIGLRLSNVNDISPLPIGFNPGVNESVVSLDRPDEKEKGQAWKRPSPLTTPGVALTAPLRLNTKVAETGLTRDPVKEAKMKTLPPVPIPGQPIPQSSEDDDYSSSYEDDGNDMSNAPDATDRHDAAEDSEQVVTLSPTVYNAQSPVKREAASLKLTTLPSTRFNAKSSRSPRSPPRRAATGNVPPSTGDWI